MVIMIYCLVSTHQHTAVIVLKSLKQQKARNIHIHIYIYIWVSCVNMKEWRRYAARTTSQTNNVQQGQQGLFCAFISDESNFLVI